jgi:hypothetical protein
MYHSSALLLPDGSVMIAGSNPNIDVNLTTVFPATYTAECFHPPYFSAKTRPMPQNRSTTLLYGGNYFDIVLPPTSYSGSANEAMDNTMIWLIWPGFTTHAKNMCQRILHIHGGITGQSFSILPNFCLVKTCFNRDRFPFMTISNVPSNGTHSGMDKNKHWQPTAPTGILPQGVRPHESSASMNNTNRNNAKLTRQVARPILTLFALDMMLALAWRVVGVF